LAHLVNELPMARALVFSRTKHGADRVVKQLHARGIKSEAIHGNKSQNARERALANFKSGKIPVLVATDIAARGIDIDDITHVVNFDLTHEPETYVHRIGRTGRAGASGVAVSFCDSDEKDNLRAIEKLIRRSIPVKTDHPVYPASTEREHDPRPVHQQRNHSRQGQQQHPRRPQADRASHSAGRGAGAHHSPRPTTASAPAHSNGRRSSQPGRPAQPRATHPLHRNSNSRSGMHSRGPGRRRAF
jgi:ATP-dependent RNA helicase RhlE